MNSKTDMKRTPGKTWYSRLAIAAPSSLDIGFRFAIAAYFLFASITKSFDFKSFTTSVSDYGIVIDDFVRVTALAILIAEIIGGIGLILNIRACLFLITGLLLLFIGVLSYGLWLGLDIDCGCLGVDTRHLTGGGLWPQLWIDLILLLGCVFLIGRRVLQPRKQTREKSNHASQV